MGEHIRVDMLLLEDIAAQLSRLSNEIERLEYELRSVRYSLPRDAETLVQLEIMGEHSRMAEATDRAEGIAKRVRRAMDLFERCEMMLLARTDRLDVGMELEAFAGQKRFD